MKNKGLDRAIIAGNVEDVIKYVKKGADLDGLVV